VRTILNLLVVAALAAPLPGCGYSLAGRGSFLPSYIRVIGVPEFTNQTTYLEVERRFTERVRTNSSAAADKGPGNGSGRRCPRHSPASPSFPRTSTTPQATGTSSWSTRIEFIDLKTDKALLGTLDGLPRE
jgi:hypothetical protein